jgi:cobalt-zinc-cadmium efflux system membrane fusion protein
MMTAQRDTRAGLTLRLGVGAVLLGFVGAAGLAVPLTRPPAGNGQPSPAARGAEPRHPRRIDTDTLALPTEAVSDLGVTTESATAAVRPRPLPPFSGCLALDPDRLARVHSRFPGEVVALGSTAGGETVGGETSAERPLRAGDRVRRGQLLAVVWSKDLGEKKSELVDAVSKLRLDRAVCERLRAAGRDGVVPERSLREADRAVESDEIAVARAERTLRSWRLTDAEVAAAKDEAGAGRAAADWARVEVRSPADGTLVEKNVAVGDLVDTAADLFKVADMSHLLVWAHVYEEDLAALRTPLRGELRLSCRDGGAARPCVLDRVGAVIDPAQHTALLSGPVDNADGSLRAGQAVTVRAELPPPAGEVEVPAAAVVEDGTTAVVFVQPDPDHPVYVRRVVRVARRGREVVALAPGSPVRPGDRVVRGGAIYLKEALDDLVAGGVPTARRE